MIGRRQFASAAAALALAAPLIGSRASAQAGRKVLRVVPQAEPLVFETMSTPSTVMTVAVWLENSTLFSSAARSAWESSATSDTSNSRNIVILLR